MRLQVEPRYGSVVCVTIPILSCLPAFFHFLQWKKYLTTMQIVQFIVDLHLVYFGSESTQLLCTHSSDALFPLSLFLLCQHLLASPPVVRQLPWNGIGRCLWLRVTFELSSALHQVLYRYVQEAGSRKEASNERTRKWEWVCLSLIFDPDPWLMPLSAAGSRRIEDTDDREKSHANCARIVGRDYPASFLSFTSYTTMVI